MSALARALGRILGRDLTAGSSPFIRNLGGGGGGDPLASQVQLQVIFDGPTGRGNAAFTDYSQAARTIAYGSTCGVEAGGPFSQNLDIAGNVTNGMATADNTDNVLNFGTNDWTVEFHVFLTTYASPCMYMGTQNANHGWLLWQGRAGENYELRMSYRNSGQILVYNTGVRVFESFTLSQWTAMAMQRNGNNLQVFIDGTYIGAVDCTGLDIANSNNTNLYIGSTPGQPNSAGDIANLRITVGTARYTTDGYTPPAADWS